MKSTGVVRRIDSLGRVVLPKELRETHGIHEDDPLEIFTEGENIILRKYTFTCIFCGKSERLTLYRGKSICSACLEELSSL